MKVNIHKSESRGNTKLAWLNSKHTFSFSSFFDLERMGFGKLRVLNDDIVEPSMGFGLHPHENMEIISIPISGSLRHTDNIGNEFVILPGEVQIMSAGSGIKHSEYNHSESESVNFLQIWVLPKIIDIKPKYEQRKFDIKDALNRFQLIVSPNGEENSVSINQNVYFYQTVIDENFTMEFKPKNKGNGLYVFVIEGVVNIENNKLNSRDGIEISDFNSLIFNGLTKTHLLLIETPV